MPTPIRLGVLGCARIVKPAIIDALPYAPALKLHAIASRSQKIARSFAREHKVPVSYGSYGDLVASPEIDAIYIPLPNSLHAAWVHRAIEHGKAILCEKPLASNATEARNMAHAATERGVLLAEAFHYKYHPLMKYVRDVVSSGMIGRIVSVIATMEVARKMVPAEDIRFQLHLSGGAMMDLGAYCMNVIRYIYGQEPIGFEATPNLVAPQVDGAMHAKLQLPNGSHGEIRCSLIAHETKMTLNVQGEHGRFHVTNPFLPQFGNELVLQNRNERSVRSFCMTPTYAFQARAFADAVLGKAPILTTAHDGVANMEAIDAVYRAAELSPRGYTI